MENLFSWKIHDTPHTKSLKMQDPYVTVVNMLSITNYIYKCILQLSLNMLNRKGLFGNNKDETK